MTMLEVKDLSVKYNDIVIVNNVSFSLEKNRWLMIVGPNGAGKSTVVKALSRAVSYEGKVVFDGIDTARLKPDKLAKCIGVLSQYHYVSYSFTVEEIIRLGRYAYGGGFLKAKRDENCELMVNEAIEMTGMRDFLNQSVLTLSGGEMQRAFLAQIFAQDPKILILDEPTNHLDIVFQKQIFELIAQWVKKPGRAVISVVHDLNLAKAYGTDAMLLNKGELVDSGETDKVLTRENLKQVYSIDVYDWMNKMLSQWK